MEFRALEHGDEPQHMSWAPQSCQRILCRGVIGLEPQGPFVVTDGPRGREKDCTLSLKMGDCPYVL